MVTLVETVQMSCLHNKFGNYTEGGRLVVQSGSTVTESIHTRGMSESEKHTFKEVLRAV